MGQERQSYQLVSAAVTLCISVHTLTSHTSLFPHVTTHLQSAVLLTGSSLHLPVLLIQDAEEREWWILPCSTKLEWLESEGCLLIQLLPNSSPAMLPWSTYPDYIVFSFRKCFTEVRVKVCLCIMVGLHTMGQRSEIKLNSNKGIASVLDL